MVQLPSGLYSTSLATMSILEASCGEEREEGPRSAPPYAKALLQRDLPQLQRGSP